MKYLVTVTFKREANSPGHSEMIVGNLLRSKGVEFISVKAEKI